MTKTLGFTFHRITRKRMFTHIFFQSGQIEESRSLKMRRKKESPNRHKNWKKSSSPLCQTSISLGDFDERKFGL